MFRYYSCRFREEKPQNYNCNRLGINRELNLIGTYTIETSIMGYLDEERRTRDFCIDAVGVIGLRLMESIHDWQQMVEKSQREKIKKAVLLLREKKKIQSPFRNNQKSCKFLRGEDLNMKQSLAELLGGDAFEQNQELIDDVLRRERSIKKRRVKKKRGVGSYDNKVGSVDELQMVEDDMWFESYLQPKLGNQDGERNSGFDFSFYLGIEGFQAHKGRYIDESSWEKRKGQIDMEELFEEIKRDEEVLLQEQEGSEESEEEDEQVQ